MKEKFNQNTSNIYEASRLNMVLIEKMYSSKELEEIIKAQFYCFYYKLKVGESLPECCLMNIKNKNVLKNKILILKKKLLPLFKKDIDYFEKTILFLLLNINSNHNNKKQTKI